MTATREESLVAGGAQDFCEVKHVVIRGDHVGIGERLGELAERAHQHALRASSDPSLVRVRRRWFEAVYPELALRAHGVARHFGVAPGDDRYELASLPLGCPQVGCSVGWVPPARSAGGTSLLSRYFDFTILSLSEFTGTERAPGEPALAGRPYIIETYPSDGRAALLVCAFDLLSGATEGINEAGLVAALLADDESTGREPTGVRQAGLGEHEVCRYLLERCASVDEALDALRFTKQYYFFAPCHFVVGDRTGRAFVWEYTAAHNREHVTWLTDLGVVTNHLQFRYPRLSDLPQEPGNARTYDRARRLAAGLAEPGPLDAAELKRRHRCVRIDAPGVPVRTLWHTIFDTEAASMEIDFYLGDATGGERRTPYQRFGLRR